VEAPIVASLHWSIKWRSLIPREMEIKKGRMVMIREKMEIRRKQTSKTSKKAPERNRSSVSSVTATVI
jgi:hypothetical protein